MESCNDFQVGSEKEYDLEGIICDVVMLKICGYTESDCDLSLHLDLFF